MEEVDLEQRLFCQERTVNFNVFNTKLTHFIMSNLSGVFRHPAYRQQPENNEKMSFLKVRVRCV